MEDCDVVVIYFQGSTSGSMAEKVRRILLAFGGREYPWPKSLQGAEARARALDAALRDSTASQIAYRRFVDAEIAVLLAPSIDGLTVALVLAAHPPPGDEAAYERAQLACVRGAAVLVRALQRTEARRRLVSRAVHSEGASSR